MAEYPETTGGTLLKEAFPYLTAPTTAQTAKAGTVLGTPSPTQVSDAEPLTQSFYVNKGLFLFN